jgi:hypothetical protein
MPWEEKSAWSMGIVTVATYTGYLTIILGRAGQTPLVDVPYAGTLLWTIGAAIVAAIAVHIILAISNPQEAGKKDQRDKEIYRFGEYVGQSVVVAGGVAVMFMAMAEMDHFWIANTIYLGFILSGILSSVAKIASYRRGFHPW